MKKYEKYDSAYGIVTSRDSRGVYMTLDNGETAFCYKNGTLRAGSKCIVSIIKPQDLTKNGRRTIVYIESVCNNAGYEELSPIDFYDVGRNDFYDGGRDNLCDGGRDNLCDGNRDAFYNEGRVA